MQNGQQVNNHEYEIEMPVMIELHPSLNRVLDINDPLHKMFSEQLQRGLTGVMETLGIPGKPLMLIVSSQALAVSNRLLRVSVNRHVCYYPDELLQRVHSYVNGSPLNPEAQTSFILAWLHNLMKEEAEQTEVDSKYLLEFLSLVCLEIIKRHPSNLLGLAQISMYSASLPLPSSTLSLHLETWPPDPVWLLPILNKALQFNISLADMQTVARVLARAKGRSQEDIAEDMVDALRSAIIEIHISQEYLKELSLLGVGFEQFVSLRNYLFQELGLRCPEFRFVQVESLKPNSFTCKINHLTMLPWIGLQANQYCIHAAVDYLQNLQIPTKPIINPLWRLEGRVVDASVLGDVKIEGMITLDPLQHLYNCFFVNLKENSGCFVYRREVQDQLTQLRNTYPALVKTIQANMAIEQITRVLRELVSGEISIGNLRFILERMLNYDYLFTDPANRIAFEDQLPLRVQSANENPHDAANIASFVRIGLKHYISRKFADGNGKLHAFDLATEPMRKLIESHDSSVEYEQFLAFLRSKENALPYGALAVLLTTLDLRPSVQTIVASELPRLPVLTYQELAPGLEVNWLN